MIGPESDSRALLGAITDAFARRDSPAGERLFMDALDRGVAWDEITATVARGWALQCEARQVAWRRLAQAGARRGQASAPRDRFRCSDLGSQDEGLAG